LFYDLPPQAVRVIPWTVSSSDLGYSPGLLITGFTHEEPTHTLSSTAAARIPGDK
jgi:hypothetical protein